MTPQCRNGHLFVEENITREKKTGRVRCRICRRNAERRRRGSVLTDDDPNATGAAWTATRKARYKPKSHCRRGHPLDGNNLITRSNGARDCRMCSVRRQRIQKGCKVDPDAPLLTKQEVTERWKAGVRQNLREIVRLAHEARRRKCIAKPTDNAVALWDEYVATVAHRKTCGNGHPRTKELTHLARTRNGRITATCRLCHDVRVREYRKRKAKAIDVFDLVTPTTLTTQVMPEFRHPKEIERQRIEQALRDYQAKQGLNNALMRHAMDLVRDVEVDLDAPLSED